MTDGTITYTPVGNYNGADSVQVTRLTDGNGGTATETVAVTVTAVNDSPVAVDDLSTTFEDTIARVPVLLNDRDLDGDTLTLTAVGAAEHGTTAIQPDRRIAYRPDPNYNGADSFTYTLSDGHGGTSTATVSIIVRPVNDRPAAARRCRDHRGGYRRHDRGPGERYRCRRRQAEGDDREGAAARHRGAQ